jgi:1-acyl-sn-glycerol-3-phosphate acyltransferase
VTIALPDTHRPPGWSRRAARALLALFGWRLAWSPLPGPKGVLMIYPHTSNWDFIVGVLARHALGIEAQWMGKDSLFRGIAGPVMRALGGIAIDRSAAHGVTHEILAEYSRRERLWLAITPEGTRGYVPYLKSGFYRIALGANLPCGLAFIDFGTRTVGVDTYVHFSGDEEKDLETLRNYYAGKRARRPECAGRIAFRPSSIGKDDAARPTGAVQ